MKTETPSAEHILQYGKERSCRRLFLFFVSLFLLPLINVSGVMAQNDLPKQNPKATSKKDKKAAKAEKKVHDKSKKEMDKEVAHFHKKKYKDIPKGKKEEENGGK